MFMMYRRSERPKLHRMLAIALDLKQWRLLTCHPGAVERSLLGMSGIDLAEQRRIGYG